MKMNLATAIMGGCLTAFVVYLVIWVVTRSFVNGLGAPIENSAHFLVAGLAVAAGLSSFRATRKRR